MKRPRWLSVAALAAVGLVAAGCSSASSSSSGTPAAATSSSTAGSASGSVFGPVKKATGTPYTFGLINETGAVTFPEARQGEIAAVNYVNNYLDGINGHPIALDSCTGDGTPATAARCANQLVASHPMAILGAADVGAPASIPIYQHANLAYLGGIPFTPVPETASNSIQFWSVSVGDNAAAAVYAGKTLGVKSVAIVYFSNPQGESLLPQITPVFKAAGVTTIKDIPLSPTTPDPARRRPWSRAAAPSWSTSMCRTAAAILAAFRSGSHQNFLSHPYTCDGQALKGATAICNDYYLLNQIQNGTLTQPNATGWVTSKGYFPGING